MMLRTPIQPILGLSKIVKDKIKDKDLKDLLGIVIKNTNRLRRLTEDILDVTRIEGNKLLLKKESVCIWDLLRSIIKEFEHSLENNNKNIKFELYFKNIDLNSVNVVADRTRITQVISNLINNSIIFMSKENGKEHENGLISINIEKTKININKSNSSDRIIDKVIISIKDNGKGIESRNFSKVIYKVCFQILSRNRFGIIYFKEHYRSSWR